MNPVAYVNETVTNRFVFRTVGLSGLFLLLPVFKSFIDIRYTEIYQIKWSTSINAQ